MDVLSLDVQSSDSIASCVSKVSAMTDGRLDILINNSGGGYNMPLADASMQKGKELFDLNVWSVLATCQAFLPLLLKAKGIIVNHSSVTSILPLPTNGLYNASKAAVSVMTDTLRLELEPFGVRVIDMKTGSVKSTFFDNVNQGITPKLPKDSIYYPAREQVERVMSGETFQDAMPADAWARLVVADVLKSQPPGQIWRGTNAWLIWFGRRFMPFYYFDSMLSKLSGMDVLRKRLAGQAKS